MVTDTRQPHNTVARSVETALDRTAAFQRISLDATNFRSVISVVAQKITTNENFERLVDDESLRVRIVRFTVEACMQAGLSSLTTPEKIEDIAFAAVGMIDRSGILSGPLRRQ